MIKLEEMEKVANFLVDHRAPNLPLNAISEVLDILVWQLSDNGTAIAELGEKWLESHDEVRVEVALEMNSFVLFEDRGRREKVLGDVAERWPRFSARCQKLLESK